MIVFQYTNYPKTNWIAREMCRIDFPFSLELLQHRLRNAHTPAYCSSHLPVDAAREIYFFVVRMLSTILFFCVCLSHEQLCGSRCRPEKKIEYSGLRTPMKKYMNVSCHTILLVSLFEVFSFDAESSESTKNKSAEQHHRAIKHKANASRREINCESSPRVLNIDSITFSLIVAAINEKQQPIFTVSGMKRTTSVADSFGVYIKMRCPRNVHDSFWQVPRPQRLFYIYFMSHVAVSGSCRRAHVCA